MRVRALGHAKVNLYLAVGAARDDGFHQVVSVFQSLDLSDELTLATTDTSHRAHDKHAVNSLVVTGVQAEQVPTTSANLAWQAVEAVAQEFFTAHPDLQLPVVTIAIDKRIPVAGGMAGGSSNAAAALRAANSLYSQSANISPLPEEMLYELAAQLGSDVPFSLHGQTALGSGRGEQISPMLSRGVYHWALITHPTGLSTPEVFANFDVLAAKEGHVQADLDDTTALSQTLTQANAHKLAGLLRNDLQKSALSLRPELRKTLRVGTEAGALAGIVSGSGPTCAFLCEDAASARAVIDDVTVEIPGTRGVYATGPAPGAQLL